MGRNKIIIFCPFYFLFGHIINNLLTELGRSVWENLDLGRWYRPNLRSNVLFSEERERKATRDSAVSRGGQSGFSQARDLRQDSPIQTSRSINKN